MDYGRLGVPDPAGASPSSTHSLTPNHQDRTPKKSKLNLLLLLLVLAAALASAAAAIVLVIRNRADSSGGAAPVRSRRPSEAISRACAGTRYPNLCLDSLLDFPDAAAAASEKDLVHISVNMTLRRFGHALYAASEIVNLNMDPHVRSAVEACLELLDDSVDLLSRSLTSVAPGGAGSSQDVLTWLSASLTNQDTCSEGFAEVGGAGGGVKSQMNGHLKDLSELVSNCLSIYAAAAGGNDFAGIPIQNRRRRLMSASEHFPAWLSRRDRVLLDMPATAVTADVIVSKDANSTCKTIEEAIKKAPENGTRRFIIYVRAGTYDEKILKVGRKKTNLMFIGDGKGKTVISGGKSVQDNMTTFHTASFAATGNGFIARDITFQNWAGPGKHQAVALRVGSDHAVIYRCNIIGYQDTLYVHSQRQFYRECDIYGTVDFIFGNAAVVFQNCSMWARKPLPFQKNTVTAQNRKDPNQNTGMSIHNCRVVAQPDLMASKADYPTFLGRPWKLYSRTVVMLTYIDSHVSPKGWLAWNDTFALDTLYYGEYMNYGPGGAIGQRVNWTGHHVITAPQEASKFTVAQFISGSSWLPSTGVSFMAGLQT